jgi:hypothetical protein
MICYDYDYNIIQQSYLIILLSSKTSALMCILVPMALWTGLVVGSAGLSGIACSPVNIENILRVCVWLCTFEQWDQNGLKILINILLDMELDGK